jgi:hypothetical protein
MNCFGTCGAKTLLGSLAPSLNQVFKGLEASLPKLYPKAKLSNQSFALIPC